MGLGSKTQVNITDDDIQLLHQLDKAITGIIEREQKVTRNDYLVCAWKVLLNLMPEYRAFQSLGIKPYLVRGLLAEIMAKSIFTEWAKSKGIPYLYKSNLLLPRVDGEGTTQIDGIFITNKFAAVVECKSYYGKLTIDNGIVRSGTNKATPWKQNYGHILALKRLLEDQVKLYYHNILYLFSEGVILSYEKFPDEYLIVNRVAFSVLDDIIENSEFLTDISEVEMSTISSILDKYEPTVEQEIEHIDFIQTLLGSSLEN